MLEAKKNRLLGSLFSTYNRNLLGRRFNSVRISNISNLLENFNCSTINYCNHSSWWDGLIGWQISDAADLDSFYMMEEKHLKKHQLFRLLGAFSVIRENPREAIKSINYASNLLKKDKNKTVWMFPQGEILPNDIRPLLFYNGISRIVKKTKKCAVIPVAFRYEFLGEFKPDVFVEVGRKQLIEIDQKFNIKEFTLSLSAELTLTLDNLKLKITQGNFEKFQNIL